MSIITISRGTYSRGKDVAERLSKALNYECISREIIIEASKEFNIPEIKLVRALHDSPSILNRFTYGKERYLAFYQATFLRHLQNDNIVYHGLAGHTLVRNIPHVLKVRIIADLDYRIKEEMKREQISADQARHILVKDDQERRKWTMFVFGADIYNPELYDLTVHLVDMDVDDAVSLILHTIQFPCFQTTPESRKKLDDLVLSAQIKVALINEYPDTIVTSAGGAVNVAIRGIAGNEEKVILKVHKIADKMTGVKDVKINIIPHLVEV